MRSGIASLLLAALAAAQSAPPRGASSLYRGWIAEHLHRDRDAARAHYTRSFDDPRDAGERRVVAAARLLELDLAAGDQTAVERDRERLESALGGELPYELRSTDAPRDALIDALRLPPGPRRDAAVADARAALAAALGNGVPMQWVRFAITVLIRNRDTERARLREELAKARDAGDVTRVRELTDRLRSPWSSGRADVDRARAWRVQVTQRLEEGRFEIAELLLARFPTTRSSEPPEQRLATALARTDLHPLERSALQALAARIASWQAAGRAEARRALALLPY